MGIAALVLGIVSIILACVPCMWIYAIILAVIALIAGLLGINAAKKHNGQGRGPAIGGVVCSVVAVVLSLIFWTACTAAKKGFEAAGEALEESVDEMDRQWKEDMEKLDQQMKESNERAAQEWGTPDDDE